MSLVTKYIYLHIIINRQKVQNYPFIIINLRLQDCIISIK